MPNLFWLIVSVGLHLGLFLFLLKGEPVTPEKPSKPIPLKTELVSKAENALPSPSPSETVSFSDDGKPILYAGAPTIVVNEKQTERIERSEKTDTDDGETNVMTQRETSNATALPPRSERFTEDGETFPGYALRNLDNGLILKIVKSGQGEVLAIQEDRSRRQFVLANWGEDGPMGYRVVTGNDWAEVLSRRALELPASIEEKIRRGIQKELNLEVGPVMLFLSHELDRLILTSQLSACEEAGLSVESVRRTVGRLVSGRNGFSEYCVESFELEDGFLRSFREPISAGYSLSEGGGS